MRSTLLVWAVILAFQMLVVTLFFKPLMREVVLTIYATALSLQGLKLVRIYSWK